MSIRRFNYTERKRIARRDVQVSLVNHGGSASFDVMFSLAEYELPADARVVLEAYRQTTVRRFNFGHVVNPKPDGATSLEEFSDPQEVLFRAKIVDGSGSGRLLAEADQISTSNPDEGARKSFIRVKDADLQGEFWTISFDAAGPVLELERSLPRESLLNSPQFRCFVLPQVFRELMRKALDGWDDDPEDESTWQVRAVRAAERLCGREAPTTEDEDDRDDWVTTATRAFCRKHDFVRRYAEEVLRGGES
jgi:hypothetical protein